MSGVGVLKSGLNSKKARLPGPFSKTCNESAFLPFHLSQFPCGHLFVQATQYTSNT